MAMNFEIYRTRLILTALFCIREGGLRAQTSFYTRLHPTEAYLRVIYNEDGGMNSCKIAVKYCE